MNTILFAFSDLRLAENRLTHFGLEILPDKYQSADYLARIEKPAPQEGLTNKKKENAEAQKNVVGRKQRGNANKRLEQIEREQAEKDMDENLQKLDAPKTPEQARTEQLEKYLQDVAKDLKIEGKTVTLGNPDERPRTPAEAKGVYLDGKIVGNIIAGYDE